MKNPRYKLVCNKRYNDFKILQRQYKLKPELPKPELCFWDGGLYDRYASWREKKLGQWLEDVCNSPQFEAVKFFFTITEDLHESEQQ